MTDDHTPARNTTVDLDSAHWAGVRRSGGASRRNLRRTLVHELSWGVSRDRPTCREGARAHEGRAHAALVMDADQAIGGAQYGSPEELPGSHVGARIIRIRTTPGLAHRLHRH